MPDFLHNPFYPTEKKSGSISTLSAILWYKSDDWSCSAVIRRLLIESNIFSLSRNNSGLSVRYWSPIRMKAFFFTKETAIPFLPSIKWYSLFSSFSKATTQSYTLRILLSGTTPYFNTLTDTQVACLYYYTTTAPIIGQSQVSWFKQACK